MSPRVVMFPQRYVQGPGILSGIGVQLRPYGIRNPLVLASPTALAAVREPLSQGLEASGMRFAFEPFRRECTLDEIQRVKEICLGGGHDALIGCGGGKVMDTGRAAAAGAGIVVKGGPPQTVDSFGADVPCIQVPTVASSDAATASVSVIYDRQGVQEGFVLLRRNPVAVLADTDIIARAPVRTLVAGMGDALATYFEADAAHRSGSPTTAGGSPTRTALMMSRLALETLLEKGLQAVREVGAQRPGEALEAVVEANILLSGVGYESGGLAAAHAIAGAFTELRGRFDSEPYHGEMVAFSTLTQLFMEEKGPDVLNSIYAFCAEVGLPVTFGQLGLKEPSDDLLGLVADAAARSALIRSMPGALQAPDGEGRFYKAETILRCLREADARGRSMDRG